MKLLLSLAMVLIVSGTAQAAQNIELALSPSEVSIAADQYLRYDFGVVDTRFSSYAYFDLTNKGDSDLFVQRISISGIDFSAAHNCPGTLRPSQYCTLQVRFAPMFEGFKRGALYVRTSDGLITIDLSGWARRR